MLVVALGGLLALVPYAVELVSGWVNRFYILVYFLLGAYLIVIYLYKSFNQILSELVLNASIYYLRKEIETLKKLKGVQDLNALQVRINKVRANLKDFINLSEIRTLPLYNYELSRLQKKIDVFFNSISEILFPTQQVFSKAEKIEQQQTLAYYQAEEHPTEDELAEEFEEAQKAELGIIEWFDRSALDEFLQFLGDSLFVPTRKRSPFSYRHPINLILLSKFFGYWNSVLSKCRNCNVYEKAEKDIEEYYKLMSERNWQRKQRMWGLRDSTIVVIVTVILTTISTLVIQFLLK